MKRHPSSIISSRHVLLSASAAIGLTALAAMPAMSQQQQRVGAPPEAKNMRLVGYNDLQARSAYQPVIHRQGDRYIAYVGHHGGTSSVAEAGQSDDRAGGEQRHLDHRRHRSEEAEISRPYSGRRRAGRVGRRADGAHVRRQDAAEGRSQCGLYAARVRQQGPRNLERHRSGRAQEDQHHLDQPGQHAQELVGVRHRHRLPRLRPEGLAHAPA